MTAPGTQWAPSDSRAIWVTAVCVSQFNYLPCKEQRSPIVKKAAYFSHKSSKIFTRQSHKTVLLILCMLSPPDAHANTEIYFILFYLH